jgi:hypothetical protein
MRKVKKKIEEIRKQDELNMRKKKKKKKKDINKKKIGGKTYQLR